MRKALDPFLKPSLLGLMMMLVTLGIFSTAYAQAGDVSRGKQLFAQNCAVCHGDNAEGRVGARLAKDFPGIRVEASLKETISNGVPGSVMPAWSKAHGGPLSDQDIDDLVSFIRSLGHQAPPVPTQPVVPTDVRPPAPPAATFPPGDATRGAAVYTQNCVVCHGDRGQGRIGATLQKDWPGINPEGFIDATVARGVPGSKMPAWSKANGGPLTDQEISDVAVYIRTLKQPGAVAPPVAPGPADTGLLGSPVALICAVLGLLIVILVLGIGLAGRRTRA